MGRWSIPIAIRSENSLCNSYRVAGHHFEYRDFFDVECFVVLLFLQTQI